MSIQMLIAVINNFVKLESNAIYDNLHYAILSTSYTSPYNN